MPSCDKCGKELDDEQKLEQHRRDKHGIRAEKKEDIIMEQRKDDAKTGKKSNKKKAGAVILAVIIIIGFAYIFVTSSPKYDPLPHTEHVKGPSDAKVTITEFSDFQCPACKAGVPRVKEILDEYPEDVRVVYKHFPLPSHSFAEKAAQASECAADQGRFWEMHDVLFGSQNELYTNSLKRYAEELGLDTEAFNACLDSNVMSSRVNADKAEGSSRGVGATPTFFVNSVKVVGVRPLSEFKSIIDAELAE